MPDFNDKPGERGAEGDADLIDKPGERPRSSAEGDAEVIDKPGERPARSSAEGDAEVIDKKVKELLEAATQSELAKWFELPSFEQAAEQKQQLPEDDPEMVEVRERRAKACAAVDPVLLELIRVRTEVTQESLIKNQYVIAIHADPSIAQFDIDMAERGHQIAEPREVEITEELRDDMKECTPQALLRDLHRPELVFEKLFEVIDYSAEQRLDAVAEVDAAMKMNLKLPPLGLSPFEEERRLLREDVATRRRPWTTLRANKEQQS